MSVLTAVPLCQSDYKASSQLEKAMIQTCSFLSRSKKMGILLQGDSNRRSLHPVKNEDEGLSQIRVLPKHFCD